MGTHERRWSGRPSRTAEAPALPWNPFRVSRQVRADGLTVLSIRGELDISTEGRLRESVNTVVAGSPRVMLDLSGVTFCDVSGLWALRSCGEDAYAMGGALVLTGLSDRLRWLFEICGLGLVFAPVKSDANRSDLEYSPSTGSRLREASASLVRDGRTLSSSWTTPYHLPWTDQNPN